jgi:hypothetical protein
MKSENRILYIDNLTRETTIKVSEQKEIKKKQKLKDQNF